MLRITSVLVGSNFWLLTALATSFYGIGFFVSSAVVMELQTFALPEFSIFPCLVFIPHGVRVIFAWLYGWRSFIPLFIAHFVVGYWFFQPANLEILHYLGAALVGSLAGILACELLRIADFRVFAEEAPEMNWRKLIIIGFIASIINSIGNTIIYQSFISAEHHLETILGYLIGDTMGVIVTLFLAMFTLRLYRFRMISSSNS